MADRPHRARTLEDRERAHPEIQMDYMFLDLKMRVVEKSEAWTTILTVDDIDTQTPLCIVTRRNCLSSTTPSSAML
eukprot:9310975-Heterocapsa_arctica.AAC.1